MLVPGTDRIRRRWLRSGRRAVVRAVLSALVWLYRHVRGLYSAVGLYLLVGLALALGAAWGFAELADAVLEGETARFDAAVLVWVSRHADPMLDVIALELTALGNVLVIGVVVLVAAAFLWFTRRREAVFLLGAAVAGNAVLVAVLKLAFGRDRPELVPWRTVYAGGAAFPSGHATTSMVVYATLAYLIIRLDPPRAVRIFTAAMAASIVLLVGLSRVYLGVHYPTDVLAGYAVGFAWATFAAFGMEVFRYLRGAEGREHSGPEAASG